MAIFQVTPTLARLNAGAVAEGVGAGNRHAMRTGSCPRMNDSDVVESAA
jgi:hypothetical protein